MMFIFETDKQCITFLVAGPHQTTTANDQDQEKKEKLRKTLTFRPFPIKKTSA